MTISGETLIAKPDTWKSRLFLRYVYVLVPVSVVFMAAILNWIALQHVQNATLAQQTELSRISKQLVYTVQLLPSKDKATETNRLGLLESITSRPSVKCARLVFPDGRELTSDYQSGGCVINQANTDIITVTQDGLALYVSHSPGFIEQSYAVFLRLTLVALLCGLSIAIVFNSLSHTIFIKRDFLNQSNARKAAESDREKANQAAEHARQASKARDAFLDTISHEIRTPLNGIIGMAGLLADNLNDETKRGYAQMITTSGTNLLALLNDTLDLSKMEAGKLSMRPEPTYLRQIIHESVGLFVGKAREKDLELVCTIDDSLPASVNVDPMRLRQLLTNLVSNAVKFTHVGGIAVQANLTSAPGPDNNASVTIKVSDTGEGMSQSALANIFDRFSQVSQSSAARAQGTGLGLSICREIATLMDGRISVESTPNEGTVFTLSLNLPVIKQTAALPAGRQKTTISTPPALSGPSILLVNSNAGIGHNLKVKLLKRGYKICHVANFEQALSAFENHDTGPVLANLDQEQDSRENVTKVLGRARQLNIPVIGMSEQPARLDQALTSLVDSLVVTPGPWDGLLHELATLTVDFEQNITLPHSLAAHKTIKGEAA